QSKNIEIQVNNKGSSPLKDVNLSATTPPDWDISFNQDSIDKIEADGSKTVKATLTSSDDAIAGDYITKIKADNDQASAKAKFRVSVKTSMLWGWVGVVIVLIVIA